MKKLMMSLAVLALVAAGCHTMDRYRPVPAPTAAEKAIDPRPDLPGKPVAEGSPLFELERALRAHFPTAHPWVLRSSPLKDPYLGLTQPDPKTALAGEDPWLPTSSLITEIRDDVDPWIQRDILIHEYAHVLAWDAQESPHGPVWASQFGILYKYTRGEPMIRLFFRGRP
jgi:hypothetical protein